MKKSKKILLWSIVPILGISSGIAGVITNVTNQNTSTNKVSNVALNSTTSLTRSKAINETESKLKIIDQSYDLLLKSDDISGTLYVDVETETDHDNLNYTWQINKGNGWETHTLNGRETLYLNVPDEVDVMITWTFKCIVTDTVSGESITSEDMKFTVTPWEGDGIEIITQPKSRQEVNGGEKVILEADAEFEDGSLYEDETVGYRWFEYDSENNKFIFIPGANENTYTFTAPFSSEAQTKKYVCRFYRRTKVGVYVSESNQAIVTIKKSESTQTPTKTLKVTSSVANNQASVRANFNPNNKINNPWYKVNVEETTKNSSQLIYQWYYVGQNGKEHLIDNANSSELIPDRNLFEAIYKDNNSHKVEIICKIYKDGQLDTIINQKTNSRFYMSVIVNNRVVRVSK